MKSAARTEKLLKAKAYMKRGKVTEAEKLYRAVLVAFPNNQAALQGLLEVQKAAESDNVDPPSETVKKLISFLDAKEFVSAINMANELTTLHPNSLIVWNSLSLAFAQVGELTSSIKAVRNVLNITPDDHRAHYNLGNLLLQLGNKSEAKKSFFAALTLKPDYVQALVNLGVIFGDEHMHKNALDTFERVIKIDPHNQHALENIENIRISIFQSRKNIERLKKLTISVDKCSESEAYFTVGTVLKREGELNTAILAFKEAIARQDAPPEYFYNLANTLMEIGDAHQAITYYQDAIKLHPKNNLAYNNLGNAFREIGDLENAVKAYKTSAKMATDATSSLLNLSNLLCQLTLKNIANTLDIVTLLKRAEERLMMLPEYTINQAIFYFLENDLALVNKYLDSFREIEPGSFEKLSAQDKNFCNTYFLYLTKLLCFNKLEEKSRSDLPVIYHFGESHCLSFAHQKISIFGKDHIIIPTITLGAKAYHFANTNQNIYKIVTKNKFCALPERSIVFLSFGEIDCRYDEGLINASKKNVIPQEKLAESTASDYVKFFHEINKKHKHRLYFLNVPAPTYRKNRTSEENQKVATIVSLFNRKLQQATTQYGYDLLDVHRISSGKNAFSNELYHVDTTHLGPQTIREIEHLFKT